MRRLLIAVVICLPLLAYGAAPTLDTSNYNASCSGTTCTVTLTSVTANDMIHVHAAINGTFAATPFTDGGDTFTNTVTPFVGGSATVGDAYVCVSSKSGTVSVVANVSSGDSIYYVEADAWKSVATSSCLDQTGYLNVSTGTANPSVPTTGNIAVANEAAISCINYGTVPTAGWANSFVSDGGGDLCEWETNPATGSTLTGTYTASSGTGGLTIATFKPVAATSAVKRHRGHGWRR